MARVVIPGFRKIEVSGSGEGTSNYNDLTNKPSINNVPLVGNLNTASLKLTDATLTEEGVPAEAKTVGAKLEENSTSLLALKEQLGNHTVKSDVPEDAVFTDTVYDDTDIKEDFTKAIDDIEIGGRNLALYSGIEISNSNYNIKNYKLSMDLVGGEKYTATIWGTVEDGKRYNARFGGGYNNVGFFNDNGDGTFSVTFIMPHSVGGDSLRNVINIFHYPSDISGNGTITKFKLEKGNKATDWSPAPEDTEEEIQSVDNKLTTNILKPTLATTTQNGITCTNNGDGTYTLNGTASDVASFEFNITLNSGTYKFLGCPNDGSLQTYAIQIKKETESGESFGEDLGKGLIYTLTETTNVVFRIRINSGYTCDNLVFRPMITTNLNATYDDDFVQYTGSTGQINSDVASLLKRIETLESLVNKTDTTTAETE